MSEQQNDPGNAGPDDWTKDLTDDEIEEIFTLATWDGLTAPRVEEPL